MPLHAVNATARPCSSTHRGCMLSQVHPLCVARHCAQHTKLQQQGARARGARHIRLLGRALQNGRKRAECKTLAVCTQCHQYQEGGLHKIPLPKQMALCAPSDACLLKLWTIGPHTLTGLPPSKVQITSVPPCAAVHHNSHASGGAPAAIQSMCPPHCLYGCSKHQVSMHPLSAG